MAAATKARGRKTHAFKHIELTLKSGTKAFRGCRAALELSSGKVIPATTDPGLLMLGVFDEDVDATAADKPVNIDLEREVQVEFFASGTSSDAIVAADRGKIVYAMDDQTVGLLAATGGVARSPAGRVWIVDSRGVGIEKLGAAVGDLIASVPDVASFTANDWAPAAVENGAIYDCPTTGAASTITLPAAAPDGTQVTVVADGTKNGHTVQYRDATGPTNLTTALTAAKRHLVLCAKRDGKWYANAYISP